MRRWAWGAVEVTRVGDPAFELVLTQSPTAAGAVAARPWLAPHWVTPELGLRVGSSAIVIRTPSAVVLVDPWLAFDDPANLAPRLAALRATGVDPAEVDLVINTHIDGVGGNAHTDGSPAFPSARFVFPAAELEDLVTGIHPELRAPTSGRHPLLALVERGCVHGVTGGEQLVPGVWVEDAPGHSRGHVVVWVTSGGQSAAVVGHVFLHPAQIAEPASTRGDLDPAALTVTRRTLLQRCVDEQALLIGPLFADPGGGRIRPDGRGWRLDPADA